MVEYLLFWVKSRQKTDMTSSENIAYEMDRPSRYDDEVTQFLVYRPHLNNNHAVR
jgi:hypothetical protein